MASPGATSTWRSPLRISLPLSLALVSGVPGLGIPALGVVGCGIATALAMWAQTGAAAVLMARDPFYRRFDLQAADVRRPHGPSIRALLRLTPSRQKRDALSSPKIPNSMLFTAR